MSELYYTEGEIGDISRIKDLSLLAYGQFRNILSKENVEAWETTLGDESSYKELFRTGKCYVCKYGGRIVGSAFLIPGGNPFKWFKSEWSYIRLVAVHPDFEGRGIGKKLTRLCIDLAIGSGENVIALHTSEFQNAARHIYEGLGFQRQNEFELFNRRYWVYTLQLNK